MKKLSTYLVVALAGILVMMPSCKADVDLADIDTEVAVDMGLALPIGSVSATMGDFIGDETFDYVSINADGMYELSYSDVFDINFHNVLFPNDTSSATETFVFPENSKLDGALTLTAGTTYELEFPMTLKLAGINDSINTRERIDWVKITAAKFTSNFSCVGGLSLEYGSELKKVEIILPEHNFRETQFANNTVNVALNAGYGKDHPIELSNFILWLQKTENVDDGVVDEVTVTCRLTVTPKTDKTLNNNSGIKYVFKVDLIDYDVIYGWFRPNLDLSAVDTLDVMEEMGEETFNRLKDMRLTFRDPSIEITSRTNIGSPMTYQLLDLRSVSADDEVKSINFKGGMLAWDITDLPASPDEIKENYRTVSTADGDLQDLFLFLPKKMYVSYDVEYLSVPAIKQCFLPKNRTLDMDVTLRLPLDFNEGVYLTYTDTIKDIELTDPLFEVDEVEYLHNVELRMIVNNGLPFEVNCDFVFLDAEGQPIEMGIVQTSTGKSDRIVFAAATTNPDGSIAEPAKDALSIVVSQDEIQKLYSLKSIVYTAELGKNTGRAKLTPENYLSIQVGIAAEAKALLNLEK